MMPLFYFDVFDNDKLTTDDDGTELRDFHEARDQAQALLSDIAHDEMPNGDQRDFTIIVSCNENRIRLQATLSMRTTWIEQPDYPPST